MLETVHKHVRLEWNERPARVYAHLSFALFALRSAFARYPCPSVPVLAQPHLVFPESSRREPSYRDETSLGAVPCAVQAQATYMLACRVACRAYDPTARESTKSGWTTEGLASLAVLLDQSRSLRRALRPEPTHLYKWAGESIVTNNAINAPTRMLYYAT